LDELPFSRSRHLAYSRYKRQRAISVALKINHLAALVNSVALFVTKTAQRGQRSRATWLALACSQNSLMTETTCFGLEQSTRTSVVEPEGWHNRQPAPELPLRSSALACLSSAWPIALFAPGWFSGEQLRTPCVKRRSSWHCPDSYIDIKVTLVMGRIQPTSLAQSRVVEALACAETSAGISEYGHWLQRWSNANLSYLRAWTILTGSTSASTGHRVDAGV